MSGMMETYVCRRERAVFKYFMGSDSSSTKTTKNLSNKLKHQLLNILLPEA